MKQGEDFYKSILDNLYEGVYFVDTKRIITYWNKGAERISGHKSDAIIGTACWDNILMHVNDEGMNLCQGDCPLQQTITDGKTHETEAYLRHKDGHRVPVIIHTAPILDTSGEITGGVEIFSDNSFGKAANQRIEALQKMTMVDVLTQIGNRRYVEMDLNAKLAEAQRYGWTFGIAFIDIDHFKMVNDTYGHDVGDEVLKMVTRTLSNNSRLFDVVGRWGGEEFIAIITHITGTKLYPIANRYRALVEQSRLSVNSNVIQVTISIGATIAKVNDTADTLVKRADELMYQSKLSGRNRVTVDV